MGNIPSLVRANAMSAASPRAPDGSDVEEIELQELDAAGRAVPRRASSSNGAMLHFRFQDLPPELRIEVRKQLDGGDRFQQASALLVLKQSCKDEYSPADPHTENRFQLLTEAASFADKAWKASPLRDTATTSISAEDVAVFIPMLDLLHPNRRTILFQALPNIAEDVDRARVIQRLMKTGIPQLNDQERARRHRHIARIIGDFEASGRLGNSFDRGTYNCLCASIALLSAPEKRKVLADSPIGKYIQSQAERVIDALVDGDFSYVRRFLRLMPFMDEHQREDFVRSAIAAGDPYVISALTDDVLERGEQERSRLAPLLLARAAGIDDPLLRAETMGDIAALHPYMGEAERHRLDDGFDQLAAQWHADADAAGQALGRFVPLFPCLDEERRRTAVAAIAAMDDFSCKQDLLEEVGAQLPRLGERERGDLGTRLFRALARVEISDDGDSYEMLDRLRVLEAMAHLGPAFPHMDGPERDSLPGYVREAVKNTLPSFRASQIAAWGTQLPHLSGPEGDILLEAAFALKDVQPEEWPGQRAEMVTEAMRGLANGVRGMEEPARGAVSRRIFERTMDIGRSGFLRGGDRATMAAVMDAVASLYPYLEKEGRDRFAAAARAIGDPSIRSQVNLQLARAYLDLAPPSAPAGPAP